MSLFSSLLHKLNHRWPLFLYAATWTAVLTFTVAAASFWPEVAYVWAISPTSSFSRQCDNNEAKVRVPLDLPGEVLCLPSHLFRKSNIDLIVPPVFAAVVVAGSAWVVRAVGLFEQSDEASWWSFQYLWRLGAFFSWSFRRLINLRFYRTVQTTSAHRKIKILMDAVTAQPFCLILEHGKKNQKKKKEGKIYVNIYFLSFNFY